MSAILQNSLPRTLVLSFLEGRKMNPFIVIIPALEVVLVFNQPVILQGSAPRNY